MSYQVNGFNYLFNLEESNYASVTKLFSVKAYLFVTVYIYNDQHF